MADIEIAQVFKGLPIKIQTSKRKERENLFNELILALGKNDLPPSVIKGLCKLQLQTLHRYVDSKSRRLVLDLINKLIEHQGQIALKTMSSLFTEIAQNVKNLRPTANTARTCLTVLTWSTSLTLYIYKNNNGGSEDDFAEIVGAQCILLSSIVATGHKGFIQKAERKLTNIWKRYPKSAVRYADLILTLEQNFHAVVFASFVTKFFGDNKDTNSLNKYKIAFVNLLIKVVIGSKTKPPIFVLSHSCYLLKYVSHQEFQETLLPAIQKAILRNPEIILESVGRIFADLTLDLSQYLSKIGINLSKYLVSKDDSTRDDAAVVCKLLAQQCSDAQALEELVKHLFAVLNGSEGKLTLASQRIGVLTGIGNLSYNAVTGNSAQHLAFVVTEDLIKAIDQEVHEGTLIHAASILTLWCAKFNTDVPEKLVDWFKKALGMKTSSTVRNSFVQCMNVAFRGNTLRQAKDLVPGLLMSVEKTTSKVSQASIITEGVSTAYLLLRMMGSDIQIDGKLGYFWNFILDNDKQVFFAENFLSHATDDALYTTILLIERLVTDHPERVKNKTDAIHRAIIYILTRPSLMLRRQCQVVVRKLLKGFGAYKLALDLTKELSIFVCKQKLTTRSPSPDLPENGEVGSGDRNSNVTATVLEETLSCIVSASFSNNNEKEEIALGTLLCAHHPIIAVERPSAWITVLQKLELDPAKYVSDNVDAIVNAIYETLPLSASSANAIYILTIINADIILPHMIKKVEEYLKNDTILTITVEECNIFNTKKGELYNKSIIEETKVETVQTKNIKRESKAYSYREQLEDIELRKELDAKKKAQGKNAEVQLTPKQQEAVQLEIAKEDTIRQRLAELNDQIISGTNSISAAIRNKSDNVVSYVASFVQLLLPSFVSPLAAPHTTTTYLSMSNILFEELKKLKSLIPHITLRLMRPSCPLDHAWEAENLTKATLRTLELLNNTTVRKESSIGIFGVSTRMLCGPEFAYCFPFLKCVLLNAGENVNNNESALLQALEIMAEHVQMRETNSGSLYNPLHLPRKEILELLVQVIGVSAGKIQHKACKVLLEVATSASGANGCCRASQAEINILLEALESHLETLREVALQALHKLVSVLPNIKKDHENGLKLIQCIWIARHDESEVIQQLAESLWKNAKLNLHPEIPLSLLMSIVHRNAVIRQSASAALAAILKDKKNELPSILEKLLKIYRDNLALPAPVLDIFGRVASEPPIDSWEPRSGVGVALAKLMPYFSQDTISKLMTFFVQEGLGDRHEDVQKNMLNAALVAVDTQGKETVTSLLPVFEKFLDKTPNKASFDRVRQSVVIIMGSLARHLDKTDPKVKPIVAKLIAALSTPSQEVQEAVANCLPPLVPAIKEETPELVRKLSQLLLESPSYGERKGASYGLAGIVKGLGILSLKQLDIMTTLTEAIQDKKNSRHREGALFAFEQLCNMLGRLFEPYIVHVLPHLLLCFGDQNHHVRVASDDTAKAVMSKLSAHGVKLVLPSLSAALEEDSWRTKTGSIELLGAMAFCAPKQLSSCLPSIVPKLIEVLSDSHVKVQKAGAQALKQIGSVIRNPEIQQIVPVLLDALQDPSKKTATCLQTLLDTKFVHFIDAPSLALIMPVVQRAFQDRSTETRKMAAQIIGNMYSLTDPKDLAPYVPQITPGLKQSLLDPVPEVRSVSARALGAMIRGMGESNFEDLLPWLMQTLTSETSSVDRSGAAQGLSEVVGGLGLEKLNRLMPDIIATAERPDIAPHVKDGYIMMFIYMPSVFQKDFTCYIGQIITPILKALADENEYVRDTALRAGQKIVNMYAESAITLLLPELEHGLFNDNWRIRHSSVQLLGDLLYKISGVTGKMTTETADEDDNFGTEHSHKAILIALGPERRNRVLAGLYIGRSDVALMVRQAALHVWKVVVTNTPRTLREIMPTLFSLLLGCLASTSYDKRQVAARTLGDLVRKLGERVLPEIIPILEKGLESDQADQRQGVCIGLSEIMASTSREMVLTFVDSLVPTVRKALCDPLPEVRQAAAKTFDSLHSTVGVRALDDILPNLLRQLNNPDIGEYTLDGLRQVMAIKSRVVLPYLVPQLTATPVNTKALSILASVAGDALTKHIHRILPALLSALNTAKDTPNEQQELEYCQSVILSVNDHVGVRTVMDELLEATRTDNLGVRRAAVSLLYAFCLHTRVDYQQYVPQLLRGLIHLFTDSDERVLELSWEALSAVTRKLDAAVMLTHVGNVRQAVRFAVSDLKEQELLPGFCLPKGITPILPIFREAILNGPPELKEQAAQGLREVIRVTSADALKPSVVHITGPLIRILGDRFNSNVKVAVLDALALLLAKVGVMLKAFLPQLQTTFLKALMDPNRQVRLRAADALSHLIIIHTRADPLFTELLTAVKNADDSAIRETMLQALRVIINPAGNKMGDAVRKSVTSTLISMLSFSEDTSRMVAAGCCGALCKWLPEEELKHVVNEHLLDDDASVDKSLRHGRSVALLVALKDTPERIVKAEWQEKIVKVLLGLVTADRVPLCLNGVRTSAYFFKYLILTNSTLPSPLIVAVARSMNHSSNEVKQLVAQVANYLAKSFDVPIPALLMKPLLPMLVNGTKEKNTMVKANSEFALVSLLHLRKGDEVQQICLNLLDSGAREALSDVITKVLRKVANQPEPKEEDLDDTLLT